MHVIVIGAGLIGTATAYFLRQLNCDVTVFERHAGPAMGTSFANGGMLTPSQANPWNEPGIGMRLLRHLGNQEAPVLMRPAALPGLLAWGRDFLRNANPGRYAANAAHNAALAAYSMAQLRELLAAVPLSYDRSVVGTLKVFRRGCDMAAMDAHCALISDLGIHSVRLDPAGVIALEPALAAVGGQLAGGVHYPDDESGDAHRFTVALSETARDAGVDFRFEHGVDTLAVTADRVTGVRSGAEQFPGDAVVVCGGAWSRALLRGAGVRLPLYPVKGYSLTLETDDPGALPRLPLVDESRHIFLTPLGRRLRLAGTAEFNRFNDALPAPRIEQLRTALRELLPAVAERLLAQEGTAWCGFRPMTSDTVPVLGSSPLAGLYLNTGHGHLGWTFCAGSARAVADLVTGREPELNILPYSLARFR